VQTSIAVTNFSWPPNASIPVELIEVVQLADQRTVDSVFVSDHLVQAEPGTGSHEPMLEALTTLGFLAANTDRIRLGALVAAATMRPAAVLIKAVTTLDVLSAGRAWFGIGAGYHEQEAHDFGVPLPPTAERFQWLADTLELARHMWAGDTTSFAGRRLTAGQPIGQPEPVSRPHPPILIGGTGEAKTLRLVARYGDACNLFDIPDGGAQIRHKLSVLADHCATEGRPYDAITKTVSTRLSADETADAFVARARALGACGIDHLVVLTEGPWTTGRLAVLADAADTIADLPTTDPEVIRAESR
jgi:alkanesulfonate monooxygenase SsuD/methylene tetrahydromethanopterin reductase-like flavin-dependent oxidoreductase (luciferase family)